MLVKRLNLAGKKTLCKVTKPDVNPQAIAGNAIFFGVWVAAINALPYLLDQLGFEASL